MITKKGASEPEKKRRILFGRAGVYRDGEKILVFPTRTWATLKAASSPYAIALRLGLKETFYYTRCAEHEAAGRPWVAGWLYGEAPPAHVVVNASYKVVKKGRGAKFLPTVDEVRFRKAAKVAAVGRAVRACPASAWRSFEECVRRGQATEADRVWFKDAIERGRVPEGTKMLTDDLVQKLASAFDHRALYRRAMSRESRDDQYTEWFTKSAKRDCKGGYPMPSIDAILAWMTWQWRGLTPPGWVVVTKAIASVRREATGDAIADDAKVCRVTVRGWKRNERERKALALAIATASRSRGETRLEQRYAAWRGLDPRTRRAMWAFALSATPSRIRERAGERLKRKSIDGRDVDEFLEKARKCGCLAAARRFVRGWPVGNRTAPLVVAPGLYWPSDAQLEFQAAAVSALSDAGWGTVEKKLRQSHGDCIDKLFLDLVVPQQGSNVRKLLDDHLRAMPARRKEPAGNAPQSDVCTAPVVTSRCGGAAQDAWPPNDGLHLAPGLVAFRRAVHPLKGKLWSILGALLNAPSLTRDELRKACWDGRADTEDRTINVTVYQLRKKLKQLAMDDVRIETVDVAGRTAWRLATGKK